MTNKIQQKIKEVFESNADMGEAIVCSDGQCFTSENAAIAHAKTLEDSETKVVTRAEVLGGEKAASGSGPAPSAEDRIKAVNAVKSLEELEVLAEGEKAKTVNAAIIAKREELTKEASEGDSGAQNDEGSEANDADASGD